MAGAFLPSDTTPGNEPVSLQWRPTEIGGDILDNDYCAQDGKARIGRVHISSTGGMGTVWMWFAWYPTIPVSGTERSRLKAMTALEDGYNRWRAKR